MTKYHAKKVKGCPCGATHDSKMEAAYCLELQMRVKAGDIDGFVTRPNEVMLVPALDGCKAKPIGWQLDFFVSESEFTPTNEYYVDVKGQRNRETQLKIRLWQLMGIPWELRIVYPDKVEVYNQGGGV